MVALFRSFTAILHFGTKFIVVNRALPTLRGRSEINLIINGITMPDTNAIDTCESVKQTDVFNWRMLLLMLSGTFMVVLDFFIINVAVPSIQHELAASAGALQFVVAGYGLATAAGLITGGRLGDLYGRRRMFAAGLAAFTLASIACGMAQNAEVLIAARILQGLAGALLQPQVLAMIGELYIGEQRAKAFSAYGLCLGLGAVAGQLVGGLLIRADIAGLGWRSCFLINVPIGVIALFLSPRLIPPLRPQARASLDLIGMLLAAIASVSVILPLVEGREQGWPAWSGICLSGALPLFLLFFAHQKWLAARGASPLVPPALLAQRPYALGLVITLAFYCGNASFYFVLAVYLQQGLGLGALDSGLIFTVMAAGFVATSLTGARIARLLGPNTIAWGALLLAGSHALQCAVVAFAGTGETIFWMTPVLAAQGASIGVVMAPLVSTVLAGLAGQFAGAASGVLTMVQQSGNALGVALIGVLFYGRLEHHAARPDYDAALEMSLGYLIVLALIVALLFPRMRHARASAAPSSGLGAGTNVDGITR